MRSLSTLGLTLLVLGLPTAAFAADDEQVRQAREEVEREMQKLVKVPDGVVTVVWTGFEGKGYDVDEARFDLDGQALVLGKLSELSRAADRSFFTGTMADGTHHLHVMLLLHRSNLSLLGGYRITQFRVNADIPFPAARALSVPVRFGLKVDPDADEPKKRLVLKTDIKPTMLSTIDDSMPPPVVPPPVTAVITAAEVAPPPLVEVAATEPEPKPEVMEAIPDAGTARKLSPPIGDKAHVTIAPQRDAGRVVITDLDAGPSIVDAGLEPSLAAGLTVLDAGPPPPPIAIAPASPPVAPLDSDAALPKRIAAGVAGLAILLGALVLLGRRGASGGS